MPSRGRSFPVISHRESHPAFTREHVLIFREYTHEAHNVCDLLSSDSGPRVRVYVGQEREGSSRQRKPDGRWSRV